MVMILIGQAFKAGVKIGKMAVRENVYINVLATAVSAAEKAGEIVREVLSSGNLEIVLKGVNDPQTAADRSASVTITSVLRKRFPKLTIICEEGDDGNVLENLPECAPFPAVLKDPCPPSLSGVQEEDIVVWVDPLDGTIEFTKGLETHVTVLIGLAVNGEAVGGVIHQPFGNQKEVDKDKKGRTIWGSVGGKIGGFAITEPPSDSMTLVTTRSHSTDTVETAIVALNATEVLRVGGAGHKVLLLLDGRAHCYVFPTPGTKRWDTCAPEAILRAAGGILTDANGERYSYAKDTPYLNVGGVIAALKPDIHRRCLEVLKLKKQN